MSVDPSFHISEDEYLRMERAAPYRSEYTDGQIYAMAGATVNHVRLTQNTAALINAQGAPCEAFTGEIKVRLVGGTKYFYPDVVVMCGEPPLKGSDTLVEHPAAIFEVLSDSTQQLDKREKFVSYRTIESLQHYVLISRNASRVEVHSRVIGEPDAWTSKQYFSNETLRLDALRLTLAVNEIYRRVTPPGES